AHRAQRGLDLFGEVHSPYAAVRSVMFAPHPALGLQPVEQPAERRLLDLQRLRQLGLGDAVAAVQVSKNPPLSARQAELADAPVIGGAHEARHVVQQEAEIARKVLAEHEAHYRCLAYDKQGKDSGGYHRAAGSHPPAKETTACAAQCSSATGRSRSAASRTPRLAPAKSCCR